MIKKVIRQNVGSIFSLKILFVYAKLLGIVFFTISDRGFFKFSKKSWSFSIVFWTTCALAYMSVLSYAYKDVFQTSNFIRGITIVGYSAKAVFTLAFIKFQLKQYQQFIEAANKTVQTLIRITVITKELGLCGREFYSIVLARILINILLFIADAPNLKDVYESKDPVFVGQNCLGYMLAFVTFLSLDIVCVVFVTTSRMYCSIGNHMVTFVERIRKFENSPTTNLARRRKMFEEFCVELDECSEIYSDIFKNTTKLHGMLQLLILLNLNFTLISAISGIHVCFVNYMKFGEIMWFALAQITLELVSLIFVILCVDLMVRRSKIPQNIDWESLCSQIDERWDKCVYQFLAQLRLEDLQIDVFGLFILNHELCLQVFSMIVGYLTILIQFSMMGYFIEES